jgi:hypothetical protein
MWLWPARLGTLGLALFALAACAADPVSLTPSGYGYYNGSYYGPGYYIPQPSFVGAVGFGHGGGWYEGYWHGGTWRR